MKSNGVILLQDSRKALISLLNMKTGNLLALPQDVDAMSELSVSPDGEWFAYRTVKEINGGLAVEDQIIIAQSDGTVYKKIPSDFSWLSFSWLNSDTLQFLLYDYSSKRFSTLFLNPFTDARQELGEDYPNLNTIEPRFFFQTYSPNLTRVLYPDLDLNIILYNLNDNTVLAKAPNAFFGINAKWSPDEKYVAVVNMRPATSPEQKQFLLIGKNGSMTKWVKAINEKVFALGSYSWSPDSSKIAFWMNTAPFVENNDAYRSHYELMIFDTTKKTGFSLCVTGIENFDLVPSTYWSAPVWSPDGNQIAFMKLKPGDNIQYDILVLDLPTNTYRKVAENLELVGWLNTEEP
jgi:Tol biopolymer transport system component